MSELLKYAIVVLIPFAVQLAVLSLTEHRFRPLRLAVPVLAGVAAVVCLLAVILSSNGMWEPLRSLLAGFLILLGLGLVLVGWALAWAVYYLTKYLTKRKASDIP